jgi:hypothetical protein
MMMFRRVPGGQHGAALVTALLVTVLLTALGAVIISITITETLIAGAYRHAAEASYAADAAFERALLDLAALPNWSLVLLPPPAHVQSSFVDGQARPRAPDGRSLDVAALTRARQADSDLRHGPHVFADNAPQWRLFAQSSLSSVLPAGAPAQPAYVLVWVADDGPDGDGNPALDSNGRLLVFVDAYGSGGSRRSLEAAVGRSPAGILSVLAWRGASSRLQ